ncbi:hypothetical protein C1H46_013750 [Malus baccata]|uniref:Uncharacterized protein n=1 Tax=Malus baccata TaxID=106549 RepID=A0A540MQW2_MALBA|nr:hypothetical protein C1H46_013750 [Malus baccata]
MEVAEGLLGRLGRQCYAVLCLGVVLVTVTVFHYVGAEKEPKDPKERTRRRLCAVQGRFFHPSSQRT